MIVCRLHHRPGGTVPPQAGQWFGTEGIGARLVEYAPAARFRYSEFAIRHSPPGEPMKQEVEPVHGALNPW